MVVSAPVGSTQSGTLGTGTSLSFNPDIGGTFVLSFRATDGFGWGEPVQVTVNAIDNQPPVALCKNVSVNTDPASDKGTAIINNGSNDPDPDDVITITYEPAGPYPIGVTNVTMTVTDNHDISASCTGTVTVTDNEPPTFTFVPPDITVSTDPGESTATNVVLGTATGGDNSSNPVTITNDAPSAFPLGTTIVTWTVTDGSGNSTTATQTVIVTDTEKPTITAPADITAYTDAGKAYATVALGLPVTDDNVGVVSVTNDAPATFPIGETLVTWTVADAAGNTTSATQKVTITDNETPVVLTKNITVQLGASGSISFAPADVNNGSSDNSGSFTMTVTPNSFDCTNISPNTVTLTVTDASGNSNSGTAIVTVEDKLPPTVNTNEPSVLLVNGTATLTIAEVNNNSTDNCQIASMSISKTTFNCSDAGKTIPVDLTVIDVNGNTATGTTNVLVLGDVPSASISVNPVRVIPEGNMFTIYLGYGPQSVTLMASATGGTNFEYLWTSEPSGFTSTEQNPIVSPMVNTTYNLQVTNEFGCSTTAAITATILVIDWRCGHDLRKIKMCHNGKTICIDDNAIASHLAHGDYLGDCNKSRINLDDISGAGNEKNQEEFNNLNQELNSFELYPNYPNPFDNGTVIDFKLNQESDITMCIYDGAGRLLEKSLSGHYRKGMYKYTFYPNVLSSGYYVCVLTCNGFNKTMIMKLMK